MKTTRYNFLIILILLLVSSALKAAPFADTLFKRSGKCPYSRYQAMAEREYERLKTSSKPGYRYKIRRGGRRFFSAGSSRPGSRRIHLFKKDRVAACFYP